MATIVRDESVKTVGKAALATVREACEFLHVSRTTLNSMVIAGQLNWVPLGVRSRRISWRQLIDLANADRESST
jgi:excisionase family DNA binding protein